MRIVIHRLDRQKARAPHDREHEAARQEMGQLSRQDPIQERQEHHDDDQGRRDHDRADHLAVAREQLEHLEEREEIPLGPRRVVGARGIGGGVEVGAPLGQHQEDHDPDRRPR